MNMGRLKNYFTELCGDLMHRLLYYGTERSFDVPTFGVQNVKYLTSYGMTSIFQKKSLLGKMLAFFAMKIFLYDFFEDSLFKSRCIIL